MHVRVFNYNTLERVHQFEAHSDYLRSIAVHPTQPYVLTSSGMSLCLVCFGVILFTLSSLVQISIVKHLHTHTYLYTYTQNSKESAVCSPPSPSSPPPPINLHPYTPNSFKHKGSIGTTGHARSNLLPYVLTQAYVLSGRHCLREFSVCMCLIFPLVYLASSGEVVGVLELASLCVCDFVCVLVHTYLYR